MLKPFSHNDLQQMYSRRTWKHIGQHYRRLFADMTQGYNNAHRYMCTVYLTIYRWYGVHAVTYCIWTLNRMLWTKLLLFIHLAVVCWLKRSSAKFPSLTIRPINCQLITRIIFVIQNNVRIVSVIHDVKDTSYLSD